MATELNFDFIYDYYLFFSYMSTSVDWHRSCVDFIERRVKVSEKIGYPCRRYGSVFNKLKPRQYYCYSGTSKNIIFSYSREKGRTNKKRTFEVPGKHGFDT